MKLIAELVKANISIRSPEKEKDIYKTLKRIRCNDFIKEKLDMKEKEIKELSNCSRFPLKFRFECL